MSEQQPAIRTAKDLTDALTAMTGQLAAVRKYGRRSRKLVVFDIALTVIVAVATWLAVAARSEVAQQRQNNIAACEQTNTARAENVTLWDYLIKLSLASPPRPGETKAQAAAGRKELEGLKAYVGHTFAPRDCQAAYGDR